MNCCFYLKIVYVLKCGRPRARTISNYEQTEAIEDREESDESGGFAAYKRFARRYACWVKLIRLIIVLLKVILYATTRENPEFNMAD